MGYPSHSIAIGLALAIGVAAQATTRAAKPAPSFETQVAPLLARRCLECHSGTSKQGGLDLSQQATTFSSGPRGAAVVPGKLEASLLWKRVAADQMPPGHPLPAAEKALLKQWIAGGAAWGAGRIDPLRYSSERRAGYDWWSLQPVARVQPPPVKRKEWVRTPIDRFVLEKLEAAGLQPSPPATRAELIRRATYDLTGLPPTPDEVAQFEQGCDREQAQSLPTKASGRVGERESGGTPASPTLPRAHSPTPPRTKAAAPGAYARLIDRLLASPRYGERWARHWLDVVRYAESQGFERNKLRPNAWKYRDWVVEALNSDLPYDEFVRLQLAGDVLRPDDPLAVIASGFLVAGPYDLTAYTATSPMMMAAGREEELEGLVGTVSQTFLGLTTNCARCHDHKFDPISQQEYYRIAAALGGTYHGPEREALTPAGKLAADREREMLSHRISELQAKLSGPTTSQAQSELARLESRVRLLGGGPTHAIVPKQPGPFHVLARGDFRQKRDLVTPGGIAALTGSTAEWGLSAAAPEADRRKALAAWITDPRNPLTARVIVNRLWTGHFGAGLVRTPNDFGFNGGQPSHPELLDWLASALISGDANSFAPRTSSLALPRAPWSLKALHRVILLSATYQQSSLPRPAAAGKDAENRLLWRQNPRRLEAEAFRDAALFVSGDLDPRMGGPGYRDWTSKSHGDNEQYTAFDAVGPEFNRRTLYRMTVRAGTSPFLDALDCPEPSVSTPRRSETTTPQQALSLLNNRWMEHVAGRWAERLQREASAGVRKQISLAYRLALGRRATADETRFGERFAAEHGLPQFCLVLLNANEFLYVD